MSDNPFDDNTDASQPEDSPSPPENSGDASGEENSGGSGGSGASGGGGAVSARVPEHVVRGVFSTGAIILTTPTEFVLDFLIRMARPHQVAARVILPPAVVPQILGALRQAIDRWQSHFGDMPTLNAPQPARKPSLDEIYSELKLQDNLLSGAYANGVMISFSPAEFSFDFMTSFFPQAAVSQRVYLAVPQVPRFAQALEQTLAEYERRQQK